MGCIYWQHSAVQPYTIHVDRMYLVGKLQHKFESHSAQVLDVDWKPGIHPSPFEFDCTSNNSIVQVDIMGMMFSRHAQQIAQLLSVHLQTERPTLTRQQQLPHRCKS